MTPAIKSAMPRHSSVRHAPNSRSLPLRQNRISHWTNGKRANAFHGAATEAAGRRTDICADSKTLAPSRNTIRVLPGATSHAETHPAGVCRSGTSTSTAMRGLTPLPMHRMGRSIDQAEPLADGLQPQQTPVHTLAPPCGLKQTLQRGTHGTVARPWIPESREPRT